MQHYQYHIFFCVNQKASGKPCCQNHQASEFCDYAKKRLQELNLWGEHKVRVSSSGCLGMCSKGPAIVIYPDGVWYTYHSLADIDKIISQHIQSQQIVKELLIETSARNETLGSCA